MKAVILAGGLGSRLSEETRTTPKPMLEIGNRPILWHIMKSFSYYGIDDFIICLGFKGHRIKDFFANYHMYLSDITVNTSSNEIKIHRSNAESWNVTLVETGENTQTGGRLKRVRSFLDKDEPFFFTYGDGVADLNIKELLSFHKKQGSLATVTAARPPARFGALDVDSKTNLVKSFSEKPLGDGGWINAGYFVLSPNVIEWIENDATLWEKEPMERLAHERELSSFCHDGFWHPMDTLRDKRYLENLWENEKAPWKVWD